MNWQMRHERSFRGVYEIGGRSHGPWRLSKTPALALALTVKYFSSIGLPALAAREEYIHRTAVYVTRMHGGVGGEALRGVSLSRLCAQQTK